MEPVTHALSGAVIAFALPKQAQAWWFPVWAMLVAISPDADVFFVHTPLQYIEYHRGITHSFAGGWALALFFALLLFLLDRTRRRPHGVVARPLENGSLIGAWGLAYLIILHHIWFDCMNSYGTQVFLPFSEYRVRWNALFIVDPLLLLPLACGLIFKRNSRPVMLALLLWTILYPLGALATRVGLEASLRTNAQTEALHLVPDAFTPFHWKLIQSREELWDVAGYTVFGNSPKSFTTYAKPPHKLWRTLGEHDRTFRIYQRYALYPALDTVLHSTLATGLTGADEYIFSDLRFGSTIPFVDKIQVQRDGTPAFRIMARILPDGTITAVRFVTTTGAGGDSGWNPPFPD
ncbi:MAG: metal-dependent hydrolase [Bilophila sp.]